MAVGTRPRDFIRRIALNASTYVHVQAVHECDMAEAYLDPEVAGQNLFVKHRSDAAGEVYEILASDQRLLKNGQKDKDRSVADSPVRVRKNDTIGFFLATSGTPDLIVKEYTDPALGSGEESVALEPPAVGAPWPSGQL